MKRYTSVTCILLIALAMAACVPVPISEAPTATEEEPTPAAQEEAKAPAEAPTDISCENSYQGESLTVYQQAALTGPLATVTGTGFVNAAQDALDQINADGGVCGVMLNLRVEDTQYVVEQEVRVYEQYREETPKPLFIITTNSAATIALKDRVVEDEIVNIAPGVHAHSLYDPADGYTVGMVPIYSDQFAGFLQFVHDNWADIKPEGAGDAITVGVIGWANAFGAGATTPEALAFAASLGVTVLPLEEQAVDPSADVTGQLQNLLVNGANVVYMQSLSFGVAQVVGTLHALGFYDQVVLGSVNWGMNRDVLNILGQNAPLAAGYYGVFPYLWWTDTHAPGVQRALETFDSKGYPESEKAFTYLLMYSTMFGIADVLTVAMNDAGFDGLNGAEFMRAMQEMGTISAAGVFEMNVEGSNRAPNLAQIRQAQVMPDGSVDFVVVQDFVALPDTRPEPE
ncbi:MAG: ABC transporter substrate-binding protein [Caldilineaceae bacterium]|nr:ABC transporter substrate-binding protein [Caldilineaceae bacterium]